MGLGSGLGLGSGSGLGVMVGVRRGELAPGDGGGEALLARVVGEQEDVVWRADLVGAVGPAELLHGLARGKARAGG